MTPATSIMRWSLRRSSLGLARNVYCRPSLPISVICTHVGRAVSGKYQKLVVTEARQRQTSTTPHVAAQSIKDMPTVSKSCSDGTH